MRGGIERVAKPAAHLVAGDNRRQDVAPRGAGQFADRERGRYHRRAGMERGIRVGVVKIEGMAERAVEQCRDRGRPGLAVAEHRGFATAVKRERFEHFQERRRGFRVTPRPDRAAEEIQRQRLGALAHLARDILEFQIGDIGGERCGFIGHFVSSLLSRRVVGLISGFKPPARDGQQPCPMSAITDLFCKFGEGANDRIAKTAVRLDPVPQDATGAGLQGHLGGGGRLRDRNRAASDAAAMGRADLADRDPDERRPVAEGDP
ncbi:hypothetical protein GALL_539720 [mine drainage metagenome]|uniref:Uncharacterized protein n=1 Tax=mine drainage metagenome TaxID=410659 RepID=A0A1J5PAI3_9ZZZZ